MKRKETIRMRLEQLEHMPEDPIWTDRQRGCIQGKILILKWVLGEDKGYEPRCKSLYLNTRLDQTTSKED